MMTCKIRTEWFQDYNYWFCRRRLWRFYCA